MSVSDLPSFFVPYVMTNVTDEKIKHVFEISYAIGRVKFIDRVLKEDLHGNNYYSIYVFFDMFIFDEITIRLLEHSQIKENPPRFYYDYGEPGYWKILLNVSDRKHNAPSKKINLDDVSPIYPTIDITPTITITKQQKTIATSDITQFIPRAVLHKKK
jgi:hypothetical protein